MTADAPRLSGLAARAQLGDPAAIETLLRALEPGLRNHVQVLVDGSPDADDILQETLWIIVRRLGTLRDTALVRAWAYRIATREAMHLLRRSRKHLAEELTEADAILPGESDVEPFFGVADSDVLDCLDRLPSKARLVVRLRFIEDLSQQEIAEALEIPLGTVKSRLAYGLQRLRLMLQPTTA